MGLCSIWCRLCSNCIAKWFPLLHIHTHTVSTVGSRRGNSILSMYYLCCEQRLAPSMLYITLVMVLLFLNFPQVLYSLKWDDDDDMDESEQERRSPVHQVELASKRAFTEIFGDNERGEIRQYYG